MGELVINQDITLTMDGSPFSFDISSQVFFDQIATDGGSLTMPQKFAIDELVIDLKINHLWNDMDLIYPVVGADIIPHSYNLKIPAQNKLIWNGTWAHTANGVKPTLGGYAETGYIPPASTTNNSHATVYINEDLPSDTGVAFGSGAAAMNATWYMSIGAQGAGTYNASFGSYGAVNYGTTGTQYYMQASKDSLNNITMLLDGTPVKLGSAPGSSDAVYPLYINAINDNSVASLPSAKGWSFMTYGKALTQPKHITLNTIVQAYQTKLNRQN